VYRTLFGVLAALVVALGVAGLTFTSSVEQAAEFRFINGTEPRTLDPHLLTGQPGGRVVRAIFEGLARLDARTLEPVPGAALSWEISADGRTYTFRIRPDARWSDGRALTAHDFAWSWRRLQDPALGAEYAYIVHMIRFARAYNLYGGHARALSGPIADGIEALRNEHPSGVGARDWQAFVREQGLNESLKGAASPRLQAALALHEDSLSADELGAIAGDVRDEAARRRALHEEAARRFGVDAGVYARDDATLVVELEAPTPYFLELCTFYSTLPVPRHVIEEHPQDWFLPGTVVSNGPFLLEDWRVGDRIRLVRSPSYWGRGEVGLASIDVLPVENATTSLNLYLTGGADWLPGNYPSDLVEPLRTRPDFYSGPGMIVYYYRLNTKRPPLDDPRVRRAINLAIDRELIVREVTRLGQVPAAHIVPPGMPGYASPPSPVRTDVAEARRLLAEAGYPGGEGVRELGILYNTQEGHKKIAEVVADQLRRNLGLDVRAYNQEWQSYLASGQAGDYDVMRAGWIGDYLDPNTFLDMWITNGAQNQTGWSDPRYDRLIQAAADVERFAREPDALVKQVPEPERVRARLEALASASGAGPRRAAGEALRLELLRQAEALLVEDLPIVPIYFYVVSGLVRPEVEGFYTELDLPEGRIPNLQDLHPLRDISLQADGEQ
jgi:oligopeptide transport system substrate-binding protein